MAQVIINWTEGENAKDVEIQYRYLSGLGRRFRKKSWAGAADTQAIGTLGWIKLGRFGGNSTSTDINPMRPFAVQIRSWSEGGRYSEWAYREVFLPKLAELPGNCSSLKLERPDEWNLKFEWNYVGNISTDKVQRFELQYIDKDVYLPNVLSRWNHFAWVPSSSAVSSTGTSSHHFAQISTRSTVALKPGKIYKFRVAALNDKEIYGSWEQSPEFYASIDLFINDYNDLATRVAHTVTDVNAITHATPLVSQTRDVYTMLFVRIRTQTIECRTQHNALHKFINEYYTTLTPLQKTAILTAYAGLSLQQSKLNAVRINLTLHKRTYGVAP